MPKTINQLPPVDGNVGVEGLIAVSRGGVVKRTDLTMLRTVLANGGVDASEIPNGVLPSGRLPGYSLVSVPTAADRFALTVPDQVKAGDIVVAADSQRSWQLVSEFRVDIYAGWSELPVGGGVLVYAGSAGGDVAVRVDGVLLNEQVIAEGVSSISSWVTNGTLRLVGDKVYAVDPDGITGITISGGGATTLNLHRLGSRASTGVYCVDETAITSLAVGYTLVTTINCQGCTALTALPDLPRVQYLTCSGCTSITALPDLPACIQLNIGNTGVTTLPALPVCTHLTISDTSVTTLPSLPSCTAFVCTGSTIVTIPTLPAATYISCSTCANLTTIQAQTLMTALQCNDCPSLTSLPATFPACASINVDNCTSLTAVPALPVCTSLSAQSCTGLTSLPALPTCASINVANCTSLSSLPTALPACVSVNASGCGMSATAVNNVLIALDANGLESGSADVSGNTAPTGGGATAAANLAAKSWTVVTD